MNRLFYMCLLLCACCTVSAQEVIKNIKRDTINIHGYLVSTDGKQFTKGIEILSRNKETEFDKYPAGAFTISDTGYFELKGAKFDDTLTISSLHYNFQVRNYGARYMVITLPPPAQLTLKDTLIIKAARRHKKKVPSFKIISSRYHMVHVTVSAMPVFPGGNGKYISFLNQQISYPEKAIDHNIEGDVTIGFTVDRDGSVIEPHLIKGIGYGCDDAVIDAVRKSPKWQPGISLSRIVKTEGSVTVNFKLTDK